ncbi:MAG TPA: hypothetical protein VMU16_05560 [Candidatus Binataceae bacterium]|nr:hypothetical protein [Candidatus Binataceae bacterium]
MKRLRNIVIITVYLAGPLLGTGAVSASDAAKPSEFFELQRNYPTIRLTDKDLNRLANIISSVPKQFGGTLEIQITSGNGEETVKSADSRYFSTINVIPNVRAVTFRYGDPYTAPVSVNLSIGSASTWDWNGTELDVSGSDHAAVSSLFRDLDMELQAHEATMELFGAGLSTVAFMGGMSIVGVLGFLITVSIIRFLKYIFAPSSGSSLETAMEILPWMATGPVCLLTFKLLRVVFGPVQFSGALSDPYTVLRGWSFWIITAVLSPALYDGFRYVFSRKA